MIQSLILKLDRIVIIGTLANSEDPDEMQHNAAFHQGLHCLLRLKQPSVTEIHVHHNIENSETTFI